MLNELCQLAGSLEKAGIAPKEWDGQLKPLPKVSDKKPCYRINISDFGTISLVDSVPIELATILRKWEPSNGNSFPGFNIQPLFRITNEDQKKKIKLWRERKEALDNDLLRLWLTEETNNWDRKLFTKLDKCLREIPLEISDLIKTKGINSSAASLPKLISRVINLQIKGSEKSESSNFRKILEEYLYNALEKAESISLNLGLLVYEGLEGKDPQNDRGAISVFFDISDWIEYPVASEVCINALNALLLSGTSNSTATNIADAYGGPINGNNDKLPAVKLPFIADVKLRAMNSESYCQYRYKTIDAESFPVGHESRKRAKGALEWLGDPTREGETWGRADSKELLFAYPSLLPVVSIKLAACFGTQKENDSESRFANAAKDAIVGLKGINMDLHNLELRVFSLKKMDKARTKLVFHRNYTAQRLVDAAKDWQDGSNNIPNINIRTWGEKKGDIITLQTDIPFPLQIAPCLNRIWKLDGKTECEAPIIARSQGIELLLDEHPERFIYHLLSVVLQNGKGLLLSMGNDLNQGNVTSIKGYDKHKLLMPSILGLLLHKLGIRKESYMSNAPFLVGRMLKLADELHALYCKEVRKNNLPPQLIGNSLMNAALDSPNQALSLLSRRLLPYQAWARTNTSGSAGRSRYLLKQFEEVELVGVEIPEKLKDAERAQLLLGYLAANPKKTDKPTEAIAN